MTDTQPVVTTPSPFGRGTLGRKLILRVVLLVAAVAILLSSATTLATRQLLMGQLDRQLDTVTDRYRNGAGDGDGPRGGLLQPGQPIGTIVAAFANNGTSDSAILEERGQRPKLSPEAVTQLKRLDPDGTKSSITLEDLGRYRVVAYGATIISDGVPAPGFVVVGVALFPVDHTLTQLVGVEIALSLLAVGGIALVGRSLVKNSLRPLNRMAATAQQVSRLQLDRGEVALAVRVPAEDANPASEVGRVGQAFNHMLNNVDGALAARQASEMKVRQFVADASHELRNPLAAIRGYAELTRRQRDQVPEETAYAMTRIESEAERMSALVEDLLLLARLDSGPALDLRPVDLTELVINAASDARAAGPEHVWSLRLPEEPVTAFGDEHRLHQVVANLLANARTHTPPGTKVETGISLDGDDAVITVTDDGPGIPPEILDQVFERFTRADTSRVRSAGSVSGRSTGLGLAIVAAVVEAHHGTVAVDSEPGRTEFQIRLPLAHTPPRPAD
ncbi:HAMP domain-containing sensor histidine kinase [Microlunatus panaciterrae]|uniref:histidine kinase n=1 Tax=Microlunatus panaciterrae TaxID=400768 RepID=A0ABS2RIV5_9ACTN|nr:HAMP domain-containing sensor histidine kinase [Microlunatus panaciterrae]MBM7798588.1 two-component system OmpR family sensor kinase [Microlunatus panaciterrae]